MKLFGGLSWHLIALVLLGIGICVREGSGHKTFNVVLTRLARDVRAQGEVGESQLVSRDVDYETNYTISVSNNTLASLTFPGEDNDVSHLLCNQLHELLNCELNHQFSRIFYL